MSFFIKTFIWLVFNSGLGFGIDPNQNRGFDRTLLLEFS